MATSTRYVVSEYKGQNQWETRLNKQFNPQREMPTTVWNLLSNASYGDNSGTPKLTRADYYAEGGLPGGTNATLTTYYYNGSPLQKSEVPAIIRKIDRAGKTIDAFAPFTPAARLSIAARKVVKSRRYTEAMQDGQPMRVRSTRAAAMKYTWKDEMQMHRDNVADAYAFVMKIKKDGLLQGTSITDIDLRNAKAVLYEALQVLDKIKGVLPVANVTG